MYLLCHRSVIILVFLSIGTLAVVSEGCDNGDSSIVRPQIKVEFSLKSKRIFVGDDVCGIINITNVSSQPLQIKCQFDELDYLVFMFRQEHGETLKTRPYGTLSSKYEDRVTVVASGGCLASGGVVPSVVLDEKLTPGVYHVKAVYDYDGIHAESQEAELTVIAKGK